MPSSANKQKTTNGVAGHKRDTREARVERGQKIQYLPHEQKHKIPSPKTPHVDNNKDANTLFNSVGSKLILLHFIALSKFSFSHSLTNLLLFSLFHLGSVWIPFIAKN